MNTETLVNFNKNFNIKTSLARVINLLEKRIPKLLPESRAYYNIYSSEKKTQENKSESFSSNSSDHSNSDSSSTNSDSDSYISVDPYRNRDLPTKEFIIKMEKLYFLLKIATHEICDLLTKHQLRHISTIIKGLTKNYTIMFESFVSYVSNLGMKVLYFEHRDWNFKSDKSKSSPKHITKLKKMIKSLKKKKTISKEFEEKLNEELMSENEKIKQRYLKGLYQQFIYRDLGDDEEIKQREEANRKRVAREADSLMKLIKHQGNEKIFENVKDPSVIVEVSRRVYRKMILESKIKSMRLQEKVAYLERFSYINPEAPTEIRRLVDEIMQKVEDTNIYATRKAIPKNSRRNFRKAEKELISMMNEKCKFIAEKVMEFVFDNLPVKTNKKIGTKMKNKDIDTMMIHSMHKGDRYAAKVVRRKIKRLEAQVHSSGRQMERIIYENGELRMMMETASMRASSLETERDMLKMMMEKKNQKLKEHVSKIGSLNLMIKKKENVIVEMEEEKKDIMWETLFTFNQMKSLMSRTLIKIGKNTISKNAELDIKSTLRLTSKKVNEKIKTIGEVDTSLKFQFLSDEEREELEKQKKEEEEIRKRMIAFRKAKSSDEFKLGVESIEKSSIGWGGVEESSSEDKKEVIKRKRGKYAAGRSASFSPKKRNFFGRSQTMSMEDLNKFNKFTKKKYIKRNKNGSSSRKNLTINSKSKNEKNLHGNSETLPMIKETQNTSERAETGEMWTQMFEVSDKSTQKELQILDLSRQERQVLLLTTPKTQKKTGDNKETQTQDPAQVKKLSDKISSLKLTSGHYSGIFHILQMIKFLTEKKSKDPSDTPDEYNLRISRKGMKISEHKPIIQYKDKVVEHIKEVEKVVYVNRKTKIRRKRNGNYVEVANFEMQTDPMKPHYVYLPVKEEYSGEELKKCSKEELKKRGFVMHPMSRDELSFLKNLREYGTLDALIMASECGRRHPNLQELGHGFNLGKLKFKGELMKSTKKFEFNKMNEILAAKGKVKKRVGRRNLSVSEIPTIPTYEKSQINKFLGLSGTSTTKKKKRKRKKNYSRNLEGLNSPGTYDLNYRTLDKFFDKEGTNSKKPERSSRVTLKNSFLIKKSTMRKNNSMNKLKMVKSARISNSSKISLKEVKNAVKMKQLHRHINILDPLIINDKDTMLTLFQVSRSASQVKNPARIKDPSNLKHLEGKNNVFRIDGFGEFQVALRQFYEVHKGKCGMNCSHLKGFYGKVGLN